MNTPSYVIRQGKSPAWIVRWTRDGVRTSRHFHTEEEAWAFSRSIPPAVPKRKRMYANDTERVARNVTVSDGGCWNWNLYTHPTELYGYMTLRGKRLLAHRFSYETFVAPIPEGLQIDHLCRNRSCVNPEHLEPVTGAVNTGRSPIHISISRASKTHCSHGHEYTPQNTRTTNGYRICRACQSAASTRYQVRRALRAANVAVSA